MGMGKNLNCKRNRNYDEKVLDAVDKVIKNIEPIKRLQILKELKENYIGDNVIKISKYIKKKYLYNLKASGMHVAGYWLARGWEEYTSKRKATEYAKEIFKNKKSPFELEFWLNKVDPKTNKKYTKKNAEYKRKSQIPINTEYWLEKGFSKEESEIKAKIQKQFNNEKGAKIQSSKSKLYLKKRSTRCKEYWIERGFSEEDAIQKISKQQCTFSKEICIKKYGYEKGLEVWKIRQDKWQKTLNDKPQKEKDRINRAKISNTGHISKNEKEILKHLESILPQIEIQKVIGNYVCDFANKQNIVEYYGDYWHCNPKIYDKQFFNKPKNKFAYEIHEYDNNRKQFLEKSGYKVKIVWENDYKKDPKILILEILQFLQTGKQ
jgi:very-short-patch-repair endonuclease